MAIRPGALTHPLSPKSVVVDPRFAPRLGSPSLPGGNMRRSLASFVGQLSIIWLAGCGGGAGGNPGPGPGGSTTLAVILSGTGAGDVVSSPPGINCGTMTQCTAEFAAGSTVILTAT